MHNGKLFYAAILDDPTMIWQNIRASHNNLCVIFFEKEKSFPKVPRLSNEIFFTSLLMVKIN